MEEDHLGVLVELGAGGGNDQLDNLSVHIDLETFLLLLLSVREQIAHRDLGLGDGAEVVTPRDPWSRLFSHGGGIPRAVVFLLKLGDFLPVERLHAGTGVPAQRPQLDELQDFQPESDVHAGILADLSQKHLQRVQLLAVVSFQQVSLPLQTITQRNKLNYNQSCLSFIFNNKK